MRIRALIAAICAAGFAAGPAATQAQANVQASILGEGYAVVGTNVDAVSALTPLSGSFGWSFGLYSLEATDLTNATIHVAPVSGQAPPDVTAATVGPNGSLYDNLPEVPRVVTPGFDSSRAVSPGTADPGTHIQTVTVTVTTQEMPLGYTSAWTSVDIIGYDAAANSAVVSVPPSAYVNDTGTDEIIVSIQTLPLTQYTMQVTFDVTNNGSSALPFKPRVLISQSYGRTLEATPTQPSYSFGDPDLGTATWSVDQSVVWTPWQSLMTAVSYTPITVPVVPTSPTAEGYDGRTATVEVPSATDSVTGASTYAGFRTWAATIINLAPLTVPAPQISVDRSAQTFTPPVTFPLSTGVGADLTTGSSSLALRALTGRGSGNSQADGVAVVTGYDLTRTDTPATLPAGGGTQDVTVTFVPRDPSYAQQYATITVQADAGLPTSVRPASIVSDSVTTDSAGQSEPVPTVNSDSVSWFVYNLVVGRAYTLTLKIAVTSTGSPFPYKPQVSASTLTWGSSTHTVGRSTTIDDDILGGTITYAAGADINWSSLTTDDTIAILDPINPPQLPAVSTYASSSYSADEPAGVDSVTAGTTVTGPLTWYAGMCNAAAAAIPTPSISLDQSSQMFTPPVVFPVSTPPQVSLAANGCLDFLTLDGGNAGSVVANSSITNGYDVSRTMSPAAIASGGDTQTVQVSITPRDPRYDQLFFNVSTGGVSGAQVDTSSIVWPSTGDGDRILGTTSDSAHAYADIGNPVAGKTYTLTVKIHVANPASIARAFKPVLYTGASYYVNVDVGGPPGDGPSTTVHDDLLGGTFTYSLGAPVHWSHHLLRAQVLHFAGLWSGGPVYAEVFHATTVEPDAAVDAVGAAQTVPATLHWTAYMWNAGSQVLSSPKISVDGSSQTFDPPATFPLSITGTDLQVQGVLSLFDFDTGAGGHVVNTETTSGFDASRTMSPTVIPAGGGTQTVTVSAAVRDPRQAGHQVSLFVRPADLVPGAVIDANSIVWPTTDPGAGVSTFVAPDGREIGWWLPAATLNTTYTLTLQIHVPNGASTSLLYKPSVTAILDRQLPELPTNAGPSTAISDAALGGTFTFSLATDVDWVPSQVADTGVEFAPIAAPAVPVDHFAVSTARRSVSAGQPFAVTVTALDASNQPVTAYAGPLKLDDSVTHSLQVVGPVTWSNGIGTASVTIAKPADDDHVVAADGSGVSPGATGSSRAITVIGPADHFRLRLSDRAVSWATGSGSG